MEIHVAEAPQLVSEREQQVPELEEERGHAGALATWQAQVLAEQTAQIAELTSQLQGTEELATQLSVVESQTAEYEAALALAAQLRITEADLIQRLQQEQHASARAEKTAREQIEALQSQYVQRLADRDARLAEVAAELTRTREQLAQSKTSDSGDVASQVEDHRREARHAQHAQIAAEKCVAELKEQLSRQTRATKNAQTKANTLASQVERLETKLSESERQLGARDMRIVDLERRLAEKDKTLADLERRSTAQDKQVHDLHEVIDQLEDSLELLSSGEVDLAAAPEEAPRSLPSPSLPRDDHGSGMPDLYAWQEEALAAWDEDGRQGVVEAVTGAGKTRLALQAIGEALEEGRKSLVVVPTVELVRQWRRNLDSAFPDERVGSRGGGEHDSLREVDVLVSTVHAARKGGFLPRGQAGLLVADEVHRYGAPTFSKALDSRFTWRLGLSATYRRDDLGDELLDAYFGPEPVFKLWYDRALQDEVIAPFDIALVAIRFGEEEQQSYDYYDAQAKAAAGKLINEFCLPARPFAEFMKAVTVASGGPAGPERTAARAYSKAFSERRRMVAETPAKDPVLQALAPLAAGAGTRATLVFTGTKEAAQHAAHLFAAGGCNATAIYSGLDDDERQVRMADFKQGAVGMLSAPKLLDEGVDVPEADLGVIVAASRSKRQMVQRLGRVVRKKDDGRHGRLVVLYVAGTAEDPAADEESAPLKEVLPYAARTQTFSAPTHIPQLLTWLSA